MFSETLQESPIFRITRVLFSASPESYFQDHHVPQVLEAETHPASLCRCSSPWAEVEDAVLSPLHLLQGLVNADGDVVVLPFAHHEFHILAVEPAATTESLQVNCRGARGAGWHPGSPKPRRKVGSKWPQKAFYKASLPKLSRPREERDGEGLGTLLKSKAGISRLTKDQTTDKHRD